MQALARTCASLRNAWALSVAVCAREGIRGDTHLREGVKRCVMLLRNNDENAADDVPLRAAHCSSAGASVPFWDSCAAS
jgi:hypothetical protein